MKLKLLYGLVLMCLTASFCSQAQPPTNTVIVFNTTSIITTEANIEKVDTTDSHILIDRDEKLITFIDDIGAEWSEEIISCDTMQNINDKNIVQIWSETSYWEVQYAKVDSTYRPNAVIEFPYFGEIDRRLYTRLKPK